MARGDILFVSLPATDGREQSGRPAVAVQTDIAGEPILMVAPITSNLTALYIFRSCRTFGGEWADRSFSHHDISNASH
jgi:mRNA-degrading endonuclease toxin of MazEF toxin-antitoxin module